MTIDYENLTPEILEEYIEFIDWSMVPKSVLTKEIREKFVTVKSLQARTYLEIFIRNLCFYQFRSFSSFTFFLRSNDSKNINVIELEINSTFFSVNFFACAFFVTKKIQEISELSEADSEKFIERITGIYIKEQITRYGEEYSTINKKMSSFKEFRQY